MRTKTARKPLHQQSERQAGERMTELPDELHIMASQNMKKPGMTSLAALFAPSELQKDGRPPGYGCGIR